jgi:hypothetical protein
MNETVFYPSFEFSARVGAEIDTWCRRNNTTRPEIILGMDDLFAAYRRVPCSQPRFTVISVYDFKKKAVAYHDVFGMNFGLASAQLSGFRAGAQETETWRCSE